jgi:hypothetical protein
MVTSLAIGSALQGIAQGGMGPNGCNTARSLSPVTPVFPNISGTLYAASSASLGILSYSPDKLVKYGAETVKSLFWPVASFSQRAKPFTLTFTGALAMYNGTVTVNDLGSDGNQNAYKMTFNGSENFTVAKKYFFDPFTFGAADFKDCTPLDGNGTDGWL